MSYSSESKNPNYAYESLKNLTSYTCQSQCMCPLYGKERSTYDKIVTQWVSSKKDVPLGAMFNTDSDKALRSWRRSIE